MYEMEGPFPASPPRAGQLPGLTGAARRPPGQVPVQGTGLPAPPTFPEVALGVVPVSSGGIFLLHARAPRKGLRLAISGSSAIHKGIHRKRVVVRILRRLSTGLFTAYPQPRIASRRTPGLLSPDVIG